MKPDPHAPTPAAQVAQQPTIPPGWTRLPLDHLPTPTFWPAGLALGITFLFWSLITSWVVFVVGLALFAVSLGGWIRDINHEREHHP